MWCVAQFSRFVLGNADTLKKTQLCDSPCIVIHDKPDNTEKIDKIDLIEIEPPKVADSCKSRSPFDDVCMRYSCTHAYLANSFEDLPRWDMESTVVTACSFVRDVLGSSGINYKCISTRVAICACYSISWKHNSDEIFSLIPFGHSFLTVCYGAMFLNLGLINEVETQPEWLHRCIEHLEGQIIVMLSQKMFAYSVLNPICKLMAAAEELVSFESDDCYENNVQTDFLLILRKVAGFLSVFVQICESYDKELTATFNDFSIKGKEYNSTNISWEDAFLLLFSHAAIQARVSTILPAAVSVRIKTPNCTAINVAIRLASMYLECHDRLKVGDVPKTVSITDKIAFKMVAVENMQNVLNLLKSI